VKPQTSKMPFDMRKMYHSLRKMIPFICLLFLGTIGWGQQLSIHNFQSTPAASGVNSALTVSNVTISSGNIQYQNGTDDGGTRIGNSSTWSTMNFSTAGKFLQYSITTAQDFSLTLSSLSFRFGRTSGGPNNVTIQISTDGFATAGTTILNNQLVTSTSTSSLNSFTVSTNLPPANFQGTLTVRIWGHNASSTGNLRFNNFRVNGTVSPVGPNPLLNTSSTSFTGFRYLTGSGPSSAQNFNMSGFNLNPTNAPITVTSNNPNDFAVSLSSAGPYSPSISATASGGTLAPTTVHVRMRSGLSAGNYNGTLSVTGGGAPPITVNLSGQVVEPFSIPYTNGFRTLGNYDIASFQGFVFNTVSQETEDGGYLLIPNMQSFRTPPINFSSLSNVAIGVQFSMSTFGGNSGQVLTVQASNDGVAFNNIESFNVPATFTTFETQINLTGYTGTNGRIRFVMTAGTNQIRFRDLSLTLEALPIDLLTFTAHLRNEQVHLNWSYENARGFDRFAIEHATDRQAWAEIGVVPYTETISRSKQAQFTHTRPAPGANYYRLRMIDEDGSEEFSRIQSVQVRRSGGFTPVNTLVDSELFITRNGSEEEAQLTITDLQGRTLLSGFLPVYEENTRLDLGALAPGVYLLQVVSGEGRETFKVVKR